MTQSFFVSLDNPFFTTYNTKSLLGSDMFKITLIFPRDNFSAGKCFSPSILFWWVLKVFVRFTFEDQVFFCKRWSIRKCYLLRWWLSCVVWGILFKDIKSCTDFSSLLINLAGRLHCHVPWPVEIQLKLLRLDIGTLCVIVFTSKTTVSIADADTSVEQSRVVLHTVLLESERVCGVGVEMNEYTYTPTHTHYKNTHTRTRTHTHTHFHPGLPACTLI